MRTKARSIKPEAIVNFSAYLIEQEKSSATIQKYVHDLTDAMTYLAGGELSKSTLIAWKECLIKKHAAASVNSMLAALNSFLSFMGWEDLKVKPLKLQKSMFLDASKELTRDEYERLVRAAEYDDNRRLSLVIQTICGTGIRVSELQFITVEAVDTGKAEVDNKGKLRTVFLQKKLRKVLSKYVREQGLAEGPVFVTKNGKPLDRSNIWRDMKKLCESAGVEPGKVFPHNLRHLFARTYYTLERDLSRLADILGHTSINTTRIYTMESGTIHVQQIERLGLIIT